MPDAPLSASLKVRPRRERANLRPVVCELVIDVWERSGPSCLRALPCIREEAKVLVEIWRRHYNDVRPHSSLDYLTPREFINQSTKEPEGAVLQ